MQQFFIINSKDLVTTTCMTIKPDKTKSNKHQPKILNYNINTVYSKMKALSKHTDSKKSYDAVKPNVVIVIAFNSFLC